MSLLLSSWAHWVCSGVYLRVQLFERLSCLIFTYNLFLSLIFQRKHYLFQCWESWNKIISLKNKTNFCPRNSASSFSVSVLVSNPSKIYWPLDGLSRSHIIFISVDFPLPEGHIIATNSPLLILRLIHFSTWRVSFANLIFTNDILECKHWGN
jgi:hypothetical protein